MNWLFFSMSFFLITSVITVIIISVKVQDCTALTMQNFVMIWLLIFMFCTNSTVFVMCISTFFNNKYWASVLCVFLWILPPFLLSYLDLKSPYVLATSPWLLASCLFPSVSLKWVFYQIKESEGYREPISFEDFFHFSTEYMTVSLGIAFTFMFVSTILYFIILLYIDALYPGPLRQSPSWNFFIQDFVTCLKLKSNKKNTEAKGKNNNPQLLKEPPIGLQISNVSKSIGNKLVLDDVSFDVYKGQVVVLLGKEGAGKSVLLNILAGYYPPDVGAVLKTGKNVFDCFKMFQLKCGYCPEYNYLFPYLNCQENLIYAAMEKGMSGTQSVTKSRELLRDFSLLAFSSEMPWNLTAGQQRKFCLAAALVSEPEIVIINCPTGKIDSKSRRDIWNRIGSQRSLRTLLVATEKIEEAEALGDTVVIIDNGIVKTAGPLTKLKKHFGEGYHLKLNYHGEAAKITNLVHKYISEAVRTDVNSGMMVFSFSSARASSVLQLIKKLEENLDVTKIKLSCSSLDHVFDKIDQYENIEDPNNLRGKRLSNIGNEKDDVDHIYGLTSKPLIGFRLTISKIVTLLYKKLLYIVRSWLFYVIMVLFVPLIFSALASFLTNYSAELPEDATSPSLKLSLDIYGNSTVPTLGWNNSRLLNLFREVVNEQGSLIKLIPHNQSLPQRLLRKAKENIYEYITKYIIAADLMSTPTKLFYSSLEFHSAPIALNVLYNTWLKSDGNKQKIIVSNHPFDVDQLNEWCRDNLPESPFFLVYMVPLVIAVLWTVSGKLHIDERKWSKPLQLGTGTNPLFYWIAAWVCDTFIVILLATSATLLGLWASDYTPILDSNYGNLFLVIFLSGLSGLWFSYFLTLILNSYRTLLIVHLMTMVLLGCFSSLVVHFWSEVSEGGEALALDFVHFALTLYPGYSLCSAVLKILHVIWIEYKAKICFEEGIIREYEHNERIALSENNYNIFPDICYIGIGGVIYFILVLLTEFGIFTFVKKNKSNVSENKKDISEESLLKEKKRVTDAHSLKLEENPINIIIDDIEVPNGMNKFDKIWFVGAKGECIGLLGTLELSKVLEVISGHIRQGGGDIIARGISLTKNKLQYQSHLGYCPKMDFPTHLTGVETLKMFANLRGVNPQTMQQTISAWTAQLGLQGICSKATLSYSNSELRKLNIAAALIGSPEIIILDQPTSGLNRQESIRLWNTLSYIKKKGHTIIIVSQRIDECIKGCDRLILFNGGQMESVGTLNELMLSRGQGFTIAVKTKLDEISYIKRAIENSFAPYGPHIFLQSDSYGRLLYHVDNKDLKYSTLFSVMESVKSLQPGIEHYTISDTLPDDLVQFYRSRKKIK